MKQISLRVQYLGFSPVSIIPPMSHAHSSPMLHTLCNWQRRLIKHIHSTCCFSGAFAKLRKTTISFVISVRPSTRNNSVPTGQIFMKFYTWTLLENLSRKFKFHSNPTWIKDTLHEEQYTFMIISRSVLLRMKNVSEKCCGENQLAIGERSRRPFCVHPQLFYTIVETMKVARPWPVYRPVHKSGCCKKKYPPRTWSIIFKRRRKAHKKWRHIQQLPIKDQQQHFAARCAHNQQQQNKQIQQIHGTHTWRVRSNTYCHGHHTHSLPVRQTQIYVIFGNLDVTLRRLRNGLHINNISCTVCKHDYDLSPH